MASILNATTSSGLVTSADNSGSLQLATNNGTTAVTINTSQNVGIGTASPTGKLDVSSSSAGVTAGDLVVDTANKTVYVGRQSSTGGDNSYLVVRGRLNGSGTNQAIAITGDTTAYGTGLFRPGNDILGFSTLATERMRIDSSGNLLVGKTANDVSTAGTQIESTGTVGIVRNGAVCLIVNRLTDDGTLVSLRQASTEEGTISVSGTTVSYNGGHLSRWSQLPDSSKDETILKGTVMSNLDDMCVWTKDGEVLDNEQLNKMKVSDVEGDTNVAGVFVNWTRDEDCNSDDMNVAMTGDMIIRIAEGVVVQKGDLLMSAGDGTAKPQGDDIVRSKTVAKVTSNHVTCTYADGSYCVPCVLMAC